MKVNLLK